MLFVRMSIVFVVSREKNRHLVKIKVAPFKKNEVCVSVVADVMQWLSCIIEKLKAAWTMFFVDFSFDFYVLNINAFILCLDFINIYKR